jgi:hypothetical protein
VRARRKAGGGTGLDLRGEARWVPYNRSEDNSQRSHLFAGGKNFNNRYPRLAKALGGLPADTVVDGEVVALDASGRPDFYALQHFKVSASRIHYFVFDLLVVHGRDLTNMPLTKRRELKKSVLRLPLTVFGSQNNST